ncbi:hypothetical protein GQ53DRAFT_729191 [Thozetella sp. PMI_491]|nr:hypothetical protein GQ53DRAFT_729191 [Thozetella sp. PMI_491]
MPLKRVDGQASIVLLGSRRTGKSTLAVIACAALGRRLIDFCIYFQRETGLCRKDFKKEHGSAEFTSRQHILLRDMLSTHHNDCILICPTSAIQSASQSILRSFAESHPVIHITSNIKAEQDADPDTALVHQGLDHGTARSCTNYEYYNVYESSGLESATPRHSSGSFLRLKRVEQDFLSFIESVFIRRPGSHLGGRERDFSTISDTLFTYSLSLTPAQLYSIDNLEGVLHDGTDALEIRIDLDRDPLLRSSNLPGIFEIVSRAFTRVRRLFKGPIIYHVQKPEALGPGSKSPAPESEDKETYISLVQHGLRLCSDFVTVDLSSEDIDIRDLVVQRCSTKIIGNYHEASPGTDGWASSNRMSLFNKATMLGCQVARLTQTGVSMTDNLSVQQFYLRTQKATPPQTSLIAYNTGLLGRTSCCFNRIYTPVLPTASVNKCIDLPDVAAPCLTVQEAQVALYSSFVLNKMHFYIIGTDVSSSLSPPMYRAAFHRLGMPHTFTPRSMASINELKKLTKDDNFGGATIAQGHKVSVLPYVQFKSPHASIIDAVNTLIPIRCDWGEDETPPSRFWQDRNRSGLVKGLYGENTDWIGVYRSIAKRLSPVNAVNTRTTGLIMGAGGLARAATYAMIQLGVRHIFVYNRTTANAQSLADHYNDLIVDQHGLRDKRGNKAPLPSRKLPIRPVRVKVIDSLNETWPSGYAQPTMIVCCVRAPVEINGPQPGIAIPPQWLKSPNGGVVIETCYEPLLSPLIRQIHLEAPGGWVIVDGLQLLPEQAAAQFELFTGRKSPHIRMCIEVLKHYKPELDSETKTLIDFRLAELYSVLGNSVRNT